MDIKDEEQETHVQMIALEILGRKNVNIIGAFIGIFVGNMGSYGVQRKSLGYVWDGLLYLETMHGTIVLVLWEK